MPDWSFMFLFNLLIPVIMIVFGRVFLKHTPQRINYAYGYRTPMSMRNRETWEFAHHHIGKLWVKIGMLLLVFSELPMLLLIGQDEKTIGFFAGSLCLVQVAILISSIFPTEIALRKHFDKAGNRIK